MWSNVTPAVVTALHRAQDHARLQGLGEVRLADLLHGLIQEQEGKAAAALLDAGLDPAQVMPLLAPGPSPSLPQAPSMMCAFSPQVEEALSRARDLARDLSPDRIVTSDQLLLALLQQAAALRADLEAHGLDWAQLQAKILLAEGPPLRMDEPLRLPEIADQMETFRILDASANRAREALRVVEDYCRFVLNDTFLTRELKTLRHTLTETLAGFRVPGFLSARDTVQDVGTVLTTPQEQQRYALTAVAQANLKRLQEALRSLEEFSKLFDPAVSRVLEQLRYQSYTLEKAIILGITARQRLAEARMYVLVTAAGCKASLEWTIEEAAAGGAQIIQLREKDLPDQELLERARRVRQCTRKAGVLFIMNDRPDIARLAEADGVHVGQEDLSAAEVRRLIGPDMLIGVSTHTIEQCRQAIREGASYIGIGPTFPSTTKEFPQLAGLEFVRQVSLETSLPAFVIGGVTLDNLPAALAAGARRVAVSHSICQNEDPRSVAAQFRYQLDHSASNQ
jgi:thiamine-phosphate pyrophosphorylase